MTAPADPHQPASIWASVISRLFGVLGRNWLLFLLLAVLLVGLPTGPVRLHPAQRDDAVDEPRSAARRSFRDDEPPVFAAARLARRRRLARRQRSANAVLQGAVIHATVSDLSGRRPRSASASAPASASSCRWWRSGSSSGSASSSATHVHRAGRAAGAGLVRRRAGRGDGAHGDIRLVRAQRRADPQPSRRDPRAGDRPRSADRPVDRADGDRRRARDRMGAAAAAAAARAPACRASSSSRPSPAWCWPRSSPAIGRPGSPRSTTSCGRPRKASAPTQLAAVFD